MNFDREIEDALNKVDQDLEVLGRMLEELDHLETDWLQIGEYLSWVRAKMTGTYRLTGEERIFNQIIKVDALLERIKQKQSHAHDM